MKYKIYLRAFWAVVFYTLAGWLSFLRPDWLLYLTIGIGLMSFFLLFTIFTPAGSLQLGHSPQKTSLLTWFWQLMKGQVALLIVTLVALAAFFGGGPPYAKGDVSLQEVSDALKDFSVWKWAIFPWGAYGLWGLIVAYSLYVKKGQAYFYHIARNSFPRRLHPLIKNATEGAATGATITTIALGCAAIILIFSYAVESVLKVPHFAIPIVTIMVMFFLVPLLVIKRGRRLLNNISRRGMHWLFSIFIILITAALFFASLGNSWFMEAYPELYEISQCPECQAYFANVPKEIRFATFYWGWFFIWMPLAGSYIAKISQGRTIRECIIGLYSVPFLLFLIYLVKGDAPFIWLISKGQKAMHPLVLVLLGAMAWWIFNKILYQRKNVAIFISGVMPESEERADRISVDASSKKKGIALYSLPLFMNVMSVILLHTLAGWYGIQFQLGAVAFPLLGVLYTGFLLLIIWFFRDNIWLNNRNILPFSSSKSSH